MFRLFETFIDPFRPHDESMPPATLLGFYWRYTRQVWEALAALMGAGLVVALIEVAMYDYVGSIVDHLQTTSPERLLLDHGPTLLWMAFVIVLARPVMIILQQLLIDQTLAPSFTNLIRWQTHRRPPPLDHRRYGPAGGDGRGVSGGDGLASRTARPRRHLCGPVEAPVGRLPRPRCRGAGGGGIGKGRGL
jgi:hypothetical protein